MCPKIRIERKCKYCDKLFIPKYDSMKYCSMKCSGGGKKVEYKRTCERCTKEFIVYDKHKIDRGQYRFCSTKCKNQLYNINENYFKKIDENKSYWLGFIFACGFIETSCLVKINSSKELLERFSIEIGCNYPIKKSIDGYTMRIYSYVLVIDLLNLNLSKDLVYHEWPFILYDNDFIRGYIDSGKCKIDSNVNFYIPSRKIIREMSNKIGGIISYKQGDFILSMPCINLIRIYNGGVCLEENKLKILTN